jgi:hypothetical protein
VTRSPPALTKRRLVVQTTDDLVEIQTAAVHEGNAIAVITCRAATIDLQAWCADHRARLLDLRQRHGGILMRGFAIGGADGLREILLALGDQPMPYVERSSPRTRVATDVYTSTEYAASQTILPHCENSYANQWPLHVAFYCRVPASQGGETPIADCRGVLGSLDPAIVAEFRTRGIRYVRNFHPGLGLSWHEVFGVQTRGEIEDYCRRWRYGFEWTADQVLRTWRDAPAVVLHPATREPTWFNHAAFFHVSALPPDIAAGLLQRYAPESLPNHTFFGDGGVIDKQIVAAILDAYRANTRAFPWQAEDLLLLDNMLMAHGRAPFVGARSVLVGMSNKIDAATVDRW